MMQDTRILTAIDVGTTKICTVIGRKSKSKDIEVLGYSIAPCDGLKKGNVEDSLATQMAVQDSVREAERKAGVKVTSAYIGVTGSHVTFENRHDTVDWVGKHGVITAKELNHVPESVASSTKIFGRKVIHAIPINYSLDGKQGIKDPLGMHTRYLEVETHLVTGSEVSIDRLETAVESAGIHVDGLVLQPLASSEAVLTPEEKARGVALVDIGGGTTDIMVFKGGSMIYSSVIPVGGFQFTNDICLTYNTPYDDAEDAKLAYANTEPDTIRLQEEVTLPVLGRSTALKVPRRDLCQLTRERAKELMRLIVLKLKDAGVSNVSDFRLVLTGGAANLSGLQDMIKRSITGNVRLGLPDAFPGVPEELQAPSFATAVGILVWASSQQPSNGYVANGNGTNGVAKEREKEPANNSKSRFFNPFRRK